MEQLIKQFIEKLDKDGVFSEEQMKEFESFGVTIKTMLEQAEEKGRKDGIEYAMNESQKEIEELDEKFKSILEKVDKIKENEIKLALLKYQENVELTTKENEIVESISKYLDATIEEYLPEQTIIDYAELDRLRTTVESIKEAVVITDKDVQEKVTTVIESTEKEISEKSNKLNEAIARNIELKAELKKLKAENVLEGKLKDIPDFEQSKIRKHFNESTAEEIEETFEFVYEQIKLKEYDVDVPGGNKTVVAIKEDIEEVESEIDRYARYAEKWIPKS